MLDNFDHLISSAGIIGEILQAAPTVKILVTSRERLSLYGEVSFPVEGMALPNESRRDQASLSESVLLFVDRAQAVSPGLEWQPEDMRHIARICNLVGGMPLAIELAATWVDTLSPCEIADEIEQNLDILGANRRDTPNGQHSIRAAFDRSWAMLDSTQQAAFRRLSVFRGGFTREAGEAVAGVGLRNLQALVNKSLLRRNPASNRYEFHELLRHYAMEQLEAAGEASQVYREHALHFASFMADRWPRLRDREQKSALHEVEADIENARAAWQYWVKDRNVEQLRQFLHTFWAVYEIRGWYITGVDLFEQAVIVVRALNTEEARAVLGWLLVVQGVFSMAGGYHSSTHSPAPSWMAAHGLYFARGAADLRGASALAQEGIRILNNLSRPDDEMRMVPLISLFIIDCLLDEEGVPLRTAQECLEVATRLRRSLGHRQSTAVSGRPGHPGWRNGTRRKSGTIGAGDL
ncbi:MAG: hypothetical protein IPK19_16465 [Chloroflexi bacterium]|nr:hypothetical protein [Chloroflexota bacterium]